MTVADKVLCVVLIVLSLTALAFQGVWATDGERGMVSITVNGELYGMYEFPVEEKTVEIETEFGKNTVKIDAESVWVEESSCPDKLDVRSGKIDKQGQMIICLPNRLMIEITGKDKRVDKVTY